MGLQHLSQGQCLPLVVFMAGVDGLTLEARLDMNAYLVFSAVALVGHSPDDEVLAGFSYQSPTHRRYFTSEDDARAWIAAQLEARDEEFAA